MKSRIIIILSVLVIVLVPGMVLYTKYTSKDVEDYISEPDEFDYKEDNFNFYGDDLNTVDIINVINILSLMNVTEEITVDKLEFSEDSEFDFDFDTISYFCDDIDINEPYYSASTNTDLYYVWTDISGMIRGIHLNNELDLIELR